MQECPLPLVAVSTNETEDDSLNCGSNIFEENKPFTSVLQVTSLVFQTLVLLFVLMTIRGFLRRDSKTGNNKPTGTRAESQQRFFFQQKILFLTYGALGMVTLIAHIYEGFMLRLDIRELEGKINAGVMMAACNFMFLSQFSFFPMLARLFGVTSNNTHVTKAVLVAKWSCVLSNVVGCYVLSADDITIGRFFSFLFGWLVFPMLMLLVLMSMTVDEVLSDTTKLLRVQREQRFGHENMRSLAAFITKLRIFKAANYFSLATATLGCLVYAVPQVSERETSLLLQAAYINSLGLNSLPLFIVFSRYTNKGIDRCMKSTSLVSTSSNREKMPSAIEFIQINPPEVPKMNSANRTTTFQDFSSGILKPPSQSL